MPTPFESLTSSTGPPVIDIEKSGDPQPILFDGAYEKSPQLRQKEIFDKVDVESASQDGFMPTAIAIAAALSGNFGPAFSLQEQKRKTAIARQVTPVLREANSLINAGKLSEAQDFINQAVGSFGPRSPEIATHLTNLAKRISEKEVQFNNIDIQARALTAAAAQYKENTGKDAPYKYVAKLLTDTARARTPVSEEALKTVLPKMIEMQAQNSEGATRFSSPFTGRTDIQPFENVVQDKDIAGFVGDTLMSEMAKAGVTLNVNDITNIANGRPVEVFDEKSGRKVNITTPENTDFFKRRIAELAGVRANIELGKAVSFDSTYANALRQGGVSNLQIITGGVTPVQVADATKRVVQTQQDIRGDDVTFDIVTGQVKPDILRSEAAKDPNRYATLPKNIAPQASQLFAINNRLKLLSSIIDNLPDIDSILGRSEFFINSRLNDIFKFNENITGRQAIQAVIKGDIEGYFNSRNIPSSQFKHFTDPLVSDSGLSKQALAVSLSTLAGVLQSDYSRLVFQGEPGQEPTQQFQFPTPQQLAPVQQGLPAGPGSLPRRYKGKPGTLR